MSDSPAARVGAQGVAGALDDLEGLSRFCRSVDRVVIESEFIDAQILEALAQTDLASRWIPPLSALLLTQSKLEQKRLWQQFGLPSAEWREWSVPRNHASEALVAALAGGDWVAKSAKNGYDGRGTLIGSVGLEQAQLFFRRHPESEVYLEKRVPYRRELAIVGCRDARGQIFAYPLVETRQYRGVCERVLSLDLQEQSSLQVQAERCLTRILEALEWRGVLAVEFFETAEGELLINEIAPRVHNSGHFTLAAAGQSQFHAQVCIALDRPLSAEDFRTSVSFGMVNLLGSEAASGAVPMIEGLEREASVKFSAGFPQPPKDYGKRHSTPLRKLGHWNWVSPRGCSREEIEATLNEMSACWRAWCQRQNHSRKV
jgi:5-(carboxyamino)imidazole ribonucleotide synthase